MSNHRKHDLLGMNFSTASHQLRRNIMFRLICEAGKDACFRCGKKIETSTELSIEHKEAWMQALNPYDSFFDYENIAYSHLSCNASAASKPHKKHESTEARRLANKPEHAANMRKHYTKERRRARYLATGH